jgi:hypothetical protein
MIIIPSFKFLQKFLRKWILFYLRRLENDHDEYVNVIMPYIHIERNLFEPIPYHISILTGLMYVTEVLEGHNSHCI